MLADKGAEAVPLKRLGDPEDIGATVVFFASQEANCITGQALALDGGVLSPRNTRCYLTKNKLVNTLGNLREISIHLLG